MKNYINNLNFKTIDNAFNTITVIFVILLITYTILC
jgi:hypothetical protein